MIKEIMNNIEKYLKVLREFIVISGNGVIRFFFIKEVKMVV